MNNILVFDTNILMDCVLFEFCKDEKDAYEAIIDKLKDNYINTRKLVEEVTDKDRKNIDDALNKRKKVYENISASIDKLVSSLNNPSLAVTIEIVKEFKYKLKNGDIKISKNQLKNPNPIKRNDYVNEVITRLVYSRYSSIVDELLNNYEVLNKVEYCLPVKPDKDDGDDVADWYIYNTCLFHDIRGIVTNNLGHYNTINEKCVPISKKGIDIYTVSFSKAGECHKHTWKKYLNSKSNKNKSKNENKAQHIINKIRDIYKRVN